MVANPTFPTLGGLSVRGNAWFRPTVPNPTFPTLGGGGLVPRAFARTNAMHPIKTSRCVNLAPLFQHVSWMFNSLDTGGTCNIYIYILEIYVSIPHDSPMSQWVGTLALVEITCVCGASWGPTVVPETIATEEDIRVRLT